MIPILRTHFSRTPGAPMFGKRTERMETSVSALTKELAKEEAKRQGFRTVSDWEYALIVRELHGITVTRVYLGRNNPNCGNSRGTK